jgi:hypothetical protein
MWAVVGQFRAMSDDGHEYTVEQRQWVEGAVRHQRCEYRLINATLGRGPEVNTTDDPDEFEVPLLGIKIRRVK